MRILQVHNRYRQRGGEDTVVEAEARLLREAGHEVIGWTVANPPGNLEAAGRLAIAPWNPSMARRAKELAVREKPDVAHVHNTWFTFTPAVMSGLRSAGVPVVMTLHNYRSVCANAMLLRDGTPCELCVGSHPWHGVRYGCYRDSRVQSIPASATIAISQGRQSWHRHVDLFLCLTDFQRSLLVRAGLPEDRLIVKPNFVPDPGFRELPPSSSERLLFVGRLSEEKGIRFLLDLWRAHHPDRLRLTVVGDGPLLDDLQISAPSGVEFLGRLSGEEVHDLMKSSRSLVFPSLWYEGLPMVVLEALAAGLPVVTADHGPIGRLVSRIDDRLVATNGSPSAWTRALGRLQDDSLVDETSDSFRSLYEQQFTEDRGRMALEDAYRRVLVGTP